MPYDDQFWVTASAPASPPQVDLQQLQQLSPSPRRDAGAHRRSGALVLAATGLVAVLFAAWMFASMAGGLKAGRTKALDTMTQVHLEQLGKAEEAYRARYERYGTLVEVSQFTRVQTPPPAITVTVVRAGADGYCLSGRYRRSDRTFWYENGRGLLPDGQTCR